MTASSPSALVTATVAYLNSGTGPSLAAIPTIAAWLPPVAPARSAMPAVYVHVEAIPDTRVALTGAGGVRRRVYTLSVDLWVSVTEQNPGVSQAAAADLAELLLEKLIYDPTLGGAVTTSGASIQARVAEDPYVELAEGRGLLIWRLSLDVDVYLTAS